MIKYKNKKKHNRLTKPKEKKHLGGEEKNNSAMKIS